MEFVVLDLEWNNAHQGGRKKPINEIIEFGAVKLDESMNKIGEFSALIKPKIGKYVTGRTKSLTHLTIKMLRDDGMPFTVVLNSFKEFLGDAVLMSWGTSDIIALMENNKYYFGTNILTYITAYVNAQNYCQDMLGCADPAKQIGLSAAAELLNINQDEIEHHRALDDSLLTYECIKRLFDSEKIKAYIEDASTPDFCNRLSYKPVAVIDIDNPMIDKNEMYFDCEDCGTRAVRKNKWVVKNKFFRADFICPECKREFKGRIQFKLKFDGLEVIKRQAPVIMQEAEAENTEEAN